jgi:hypothetical protein
VLDPFLHQRIAKALGWSVSDTQSMSLPALREIVRPVDPRLAAEISDAIQYGSHVSRGPKRKYGRALGRRYGRATRIDRKRERDVVLTASVKLLQGRRLEVQAKSGPPIYMGSSNVDRRDSFWYEHTGGRTYKETPEEVVRAVLRHVGYAAIEQAKVYER